MQNIYQESRRRLFCGTQLDNGISTLRDYRIRRESTIQMLARVLGN